MKLAALLLCAVVPAGCTVMYSWAKPGASSREFNRDKYDCVREATGYGSSSGASAYGGWSDSGPRTHWPIYNTCMQAKGWERGWFGEHKYLP